MIWPSDGAFESLVTLASRIASELAQPAWPSTRLSQTGRLGDTAIENRGCRETHRQAKDSGPSFVR